jgi:hypothetical protein
MMTLNGNEKALEKQAKVCVMVNGNANAVANAKGWKGAVKSAFVNKVKDLRNAALHATYQGAPSL